MARDAYLPKRDAARGDLDYFPTPPAATRAFLSSFKKITGECLIAGRRVWEPACGGGHMSRVILEFSPKELLSSDIVDRGFGAVANFLDPDDPLAGDICASGLDVIITNPPYDRSAEDFIARACSPSLPNRWAAMLSRFQFLEGGRRFDRLWHPGGPCRPWFVFLYVARVQMVTGRLANDGDGGSSIAFSWLVFDKTADPNCPVLFDWVDNRNDARQLSVI